MVASPQKAQAAQRWVAHTAAARKSRGDEGGYIPPRRPRPAQAPAAQGRWGEGSGGTAAPAGAAALTGRSCATPAPRGPLAAANSGPGRVDSGPSRVDSGPSRVDSGPGRVDSGPGRVDENSGAPRRQLFCE
eukprot:1196269-Prorocentrum_minimum.AAC.3